MAAAVNVTTRFVAPKVGQLGTVLLIEDDVHVARSLMRVMNQEGYTCVHAASGAAAVEKVMSRSFDAVISDLNLEGSSGVDVLNVVRAYDPDVPLVLMTGAPTVDTAIEAVSLGVLEYLVKPTPREQLVRVLSRATKARRIALDQREATDSERRAANDVATVRPPSSIPAALAPSSAGETMPASNPEAKPASNPAALARTVPALAAFTSAVANPTLQSVIAITNPPTPVTEPAPCSSMRASYDRALASLAVNLEPIAEAKSKKLIGFSARMFSREETLSTEAALVVAAERLGCLEDLRRRVRDLAVKAFVAAPQDALLFVDVHPSDLRDGDLYSPEPPLARIAERVVLQVRARGLAIDDLSARASVLRFIGFRLAIADLDPGHACLSQIAELSPEFVKIDSRLIRGIDSSAPRARLVGALVSMCRALDAVSIAEGVSTAEECAALTEVGCVVVQGSIVIRHALPSKAP